MTIYAIPGHFRLHRIKTNRNPVYFSAHSTIRMTICGAYAIRPYTGTRKNDDYFIPRIKTNRNPDKFSSGRVGAYCIRPTDEHVRGRTNPIPIRFLIHQVKTNQNPDKFLPGRVGAYCIRPTDGHASGRTDRKIAIFSGTRVGAYCIRPTDGHARGRSKLIPIQFLIPRIKTNRNPVYFPIRPTFCMVIYGAYAVAPYTDNKNLVHFPVRPIIRMAVCGAYAVAPYTGT